ncbi:DUF1501 domain-containing protein [Roseimaritima ulvae]|uniref:DUF1501 domain-containing protein n=1 Tax=Roseimaritima ulvae TaxID=980254 RepID=A0A5B9QWJ8_9BACT|nr:DUF1501 domain-containing protein [Roseimaritima ulvae]QEG38341.1 hypothetical protein UC8_02980 [Roseimaritima ulvae]
MHTPPICNTTQHFSRRSLLKAAGGGLFLSPLAAQLALADELSGGKERPKSVILLWMEGAPSQLETFDPHPGTSIGGEVTAIGTSNGNLQISNLLPQVAEQMHRAALVRSVTGKEGDHKRAVYNVKTGYRPNPSIVHPSIGSVVCHESNVGADIPRHVSILPGGSPARGGYLGPTYDAFKVYDPATSVPDVARRTTPERFNRRIDDLLNVVEDEFSRGRIADLERQRTLHTTATRAALTMMDSEQLNAFDVSQESKQLVTDFGDTAFGRGCLAAARLIEVGVRCVEVTLTGWDSHVNNHELQSSACQTLDPALATLLKTLAERDLLDTTLVVCGGEFGRTPGINPVGGRDHWPHGFSTLLAGCGIRAGAVHGATAPEPDLKADDLVAKNVEAPVTVADLHATILKAVGVEYDRILDTPVGRPMALSEGTPIRSILA